MVRLKSALARCHLLLPCPGLMLSRLTLTDTGAQAEVSEALAKDS